MRVLILEHSDDAPTIAAGELASLCAQAIAARGRCCLAVSGGSTPAAMLEALTRCALPWDRLHVLQVDERIAPEGDSARNIEMIRGSLATAPLPASNLHPAPVIPDPGSAAERYAGLLRELCGDPPVLDVVHLGLGADGHTASLVPGDPVLGSTQAVAATEPYAGHRRVTFTYPTINRARAILWLVSGEEKADALARLVSADPSIPAGRITPERAVLVADPAAARGLQQPTSNRRRNT